jgi:predicted Zn-dependent protease
MRAALVLALLAVTAPASAETRALAGARVELAVPDGWSVEETSSQLTMTGPNREVSFVVQVLEASGADALEKALRTGDAFVGTIATDVKWAGKPQQRTINGLRALSNKATAKIAGKGAHVALFVIRTPADKLLLVVAAVDSAHEKRHSPSLVRLIDSIRPT